MSKLPLVGVEAVVKNFSGFNAAMQKVNDLIEESGKKTQEAAKRSDPLTKAFDSIKKSLASTQKTDTLTKGFLGAFDAVEKRASAFKENLVGFLSDKGGIGQAIGSVVQNINALPLVAGVASVAIAGLTAAVAGFLALGNRGAPLIGLGESFDKLTASVGIASQTLLVDLQEASLGTVAAFDLIKQANVALAGATGEFGKQFGQNLPKLLEIARVQARATGQSVDYLYQSIITGIKRGSPLLIDNIGLVLKVGEANQAYADSIGKSVEQLSAEEKQIAILNATLEAGQGVLDVYGAQQETAAEKLARSQAIITDTLDSLSLAVQPAFEQVLDVVNKMLTGFQELAVGLAPILGAIVSVVTTVFTHIYNIAYSIIEPIKNAFLSFLPYISIVFQSVANILSGVSTVIQNVVGGIVNFLRGVSQNLFGIDIDNLGPSLFNGAAAAFGSFANGIISVANSLIFPAVIGIAQFIADFLIGFSPPKMGPLSVIDKGGENLMLAWLDGITGVSLQPVEDVAAEVSAALGAIGKAGLGAVEKRLSQLDKALLPFQNRLDIVKSQFDAIAAPGQAALDAIDRQLTAAQEALTSGDLTAAETIKTLDAQRAAIQANLDAQQGIVDRAQIQLALAQGQQAQERALLNIRKAQLAVVNKAATATDKAPGATKEEKPKAGTPAAEEAIAGAGITMPTGGDSVLDLLGGQQAVNDAIAGIQDAFAGQIDTSQLALFQDNQGLLQEQFDRIGSVDLGAKLSDKFSGITDLFNPDIEGSPANLVSRFFSPDPSTPGSLAGFVNSIPSTVESLAGGIKTSLETFFNGIFNPTVEGSPAAVLQTLFAGAEVEGSIAYMFAQLPANAAAAASSLFDELKTQVFDPVTNFLTGEGEGTLSGILDDVIAFFGDLPNRILDVLQGLAATIYAAVVSPVISVMNSLIGAVEEGLKGVLGFFSSIVNDILVQLDAANLGGLVPQFVRDLAAGLKDKSTTLSLGRISTVNPFAEAPGAARGGQFTGGMLKVGERGPEYLYNASKVGVLPNELLRAIDGLSSILAQPSPMMVPAGGDSYNSASTFNFNGVQSDNDARRRYNSLRAGMR